MKKLVKLAKSVALAIIVTAALALLGWVNAFLFFSGYQTEIGVFWLIVFLAALTYAFYAEVE